MQAIHYPAQLPNEALWEACLQAIHNPAPMPTEAIAGKVYLPQGSPASPKSKATVEALKSCESLPHYSAVNQAPALREALW